VLAPAGHRSEAPEACVRAKQGFHQLWTDKDFSKTREAMVLGVKEMEGPLDLKGHRVGTEWLLHSVPCEHMADHCHLQRATLVQTQGLLESMSKPFERAGHQLSAIRSWVSFPGLPLVSGSSLCLSADNEVLARPGALGFSPSHELTCKLLLSSTALSSHHRHLH
jgi:hypothetical protein